MEPGCAIANPAISRRRGAGWRATWWLAAGAPNEGYAVYQHLRTQILQRLQENHWNTVAITSPSKSSGKTLTAINLAISIARDYNYTVLVVELDLVNPSFQRILGFQQRQGIVDHLLHDVPIPEILLNPGIDRLVVIPLVRR